MSSSDERDIDEILGEADKKDLEKMYVSPQGPENWQEILGVVPAPTNNDVVNTAGLAPCDGSSGELRVSEAFSFSSPFVAIQNLTC